MSKKIIAFPKTLAMLKEVSVTNEEYVKALEYVRQYTVAIKNVYQVPPLHCGVDIQKKIQDCADAMYEEAAKWASIEGVLDLYEPSIENYVKRVERFSKECISYIDRAKQDPIYIEDVCLKLIDAARYAYQMQDEIKTCKKNLENFASGDVQAISENLEIIVQQLMKGEDVDQDRIEQLNEDIEKMEQEIDALEASIAGFAVVDAVSLAGLIIGVVVIPTAIAKIACGLVFGIAVGLSSVYIHLDLAKINACKDQIEFDMEQLTMYEQDIATIQQLERQFNGFLDNIENLESALDTINTAWGTLAQDSEDMVSDIKAAADDLKTEEWEAMKNELNEVISVCEEFDEHIKVVKVGDATVTTAQILFGMSAEEIEAAVNAAEKIPYVDYMMTVV